MQGYDCLVICDQGDESLAAFVETAIEGLARSARINATDLADLRAAQGSEMGVLIVPVRQDSDLARIDAQIERFRAAHAHVSVLGLAATCALAARLPVGGLFDAVVSLEWSSVAELIRRFVQGHRTTVQNRAFRAFLEHSVDGYWIWNVVRDQLEWSDRTRQMTGTLPDQVPGDIAAFTAMIHPQDLDRVEQAIRNHLEHGAPYQNIELRLRSSNGTYGTFLANGQALRDETGRAIILVGSLTDRTLIQRVEQQLEDTQKRFTVLFHQMNDAAVLADIETGLILEANQPAERLWGKSVAELIGTHQSDLHPPVLSAEARKAFADHIAALMQNKRDSLRVPILRSDGIEVPTEISSSLIEIDGRTCILGVFRDIRDRVKAERDLRERDAQIQLSSHLASMGTLAAGVAHEINNPLTYVIGNLEMIRSMLADRGIDDAEINEAIDTASTGGRYVREIVQDLKAISRMDTADEQCDAGEVIRIASRIAMSDLRHTARLDMDLADLPPVPISSARLSQVILNILSNASRAFASADQKKNRITVRAWQEAGFVHITVKDNGSGISREDLSRVWEPFFTKRSEKGGTGLGLSISRRILHEVSGTLEIESELGRGTCVTIRLPLAEVGQAPQVETPVMAPPAAPQRKRLLVVDDDVLVSNVLEKMLRKDFDVTVHNSALTALAEIRSGASFDVALCDIMMPEMDGAAFYREVKGQMPFLFLTGGAVASGSIEFERKMAAAGRVLYKPFESADLRQRLLALAGQTHAAPGPDRPVPVKAAPGRLMDSKVLCELEAAMGRDGLRHQLAKFVDQLNGLRDAAPGIEPAALILQAHKLGGAASVLGLRDIGTSLYASESAASAGDLDGALHQLANLSGDAARLSAFLEQY